MVADNVHRAFDPTPASARSARRFVTETLQSWNLGTLVEPAALLVSELMANVVLHAGTAAVVSVQRGAGTVRVEVSDRNPRLPVRKHYSPGAATGRGLNLVDTLSDGWGVEPTAAGKLLWFELTAPPRDAWESGDCMGARA